MFSRGTKRDQWHEIGLLVWDINHFSANPQNGQTLVTSCLSVFDHFVALPLKELMSFLTYFEANLKPD